MTRIVKRIARGVEYGQLLIAAWTFSCCCMGGCVAPHAADVQPGAVAAGAVNVQPGAVDVSLISAPTAKVLLNWLELRFKQTGWKIDETNTLRRRHMERVQAASTQAAGKSRDEAAAARAEARAARGESAAAHARARQILMVHLGELGTGVLGLITWWLKRKQGATHGRGQELSEES